MSLLSVTVKKARYVGAQASQFNTYVTLKLQNVKSTTVTVKGATPCWEQDFLFETSNLNTGLLIEVWSKGMIWDRAMGYHWIPLQTVHYTIEEGNGQWLSLDAELVMKDGEVVGTKMATGHSLLVDYRFELPFDPENMDASDLQRKLETLNKWIDMEARTEQANRHFNYIGRSGYSEDSDYTSDLNYPVGQHPNSSASQFRTAAHQMNTPQRSLETSRENSYERDDGSGGQYLTAAAQQGPMTHQNRLSPGGHRRHLQQGIQRYSPNNIDEFNSYGGNISGQNSRQYPENSLDSDPLFYNSRPRSKPDMLSHDIWVSCESSYYNQSVDSMDAGYSVESDYYGSQPSTKKALRRPSLERQTTLYDDSIYFNDTGQTTFYTAPEVTQVNYLTSSSTFNQSNQSCDEYYDTLSYPFQEERYGQDEEDRQWDSGGTFFNDTSTPTKPSSVGKTGKKLPVVPAIQGQKRRSSFAAMDEGYMGYGDENYRTSIPTPLGRRKMPQIPTKRTSSRQSSFTEDSYKMSDMPSHRGASLPPTPTKGSSKILPKIQPQAKSAFNSLPTTPGRQLPKPNVNNRSAKTLRNNRMKRTSSAEYGETDTYDNYYIRAGAVSAQNYNEDYNYAYRSIDDNLPEEDNLTPIIPVAVPSASDIRTTSASNHLNNTYFNAQDTNNGYYSDSGYYAKQLRSTSPLLQQQAGDRLENRDDEFKDSSFETVVSSVNSAIFQQGKSGTYSNYSAYSTVGDIGIGSGVNREGGSHLQEYGVDQTVRKPKAISEAATTVVSTVATVHSQNSIRNHRSMVKQESIDQSNKPFLNHQESIDSFGYQQNQASPYQPLENSSYDKNQVTSYQTGLVTGYDKNHVTGYEQDEYQHVPVSDYQQATNARGALVEQYSEYEEDPYLEAQESIESYVEEDLSDEIHSSDYPKPPPAVLTTTQHESPSNDIYADEEGGSLRRGSSQITVVDPYHPSLQQRTSLPQAGTRRTSDSTPGTSRKPSDAYPGFEDTFGRKPSVVDASGLPRHSSIHHSPVTVPTVTVQSDYPDDIPEENHILDEHHVIEQKKEDRPYDEEQKEQRPKITAQQRWLWAYNKIIMQLNVSLQYILSVVFSS